MAGKVVSNVVQLGDSSTATQNFSLQSNVDGTMKLARGNFGSTTQDILTVSGAGLVTAGAGVAVTGTLSATGAITSTGLTVTGAVSTTLNGLTYNAISGGAGTNAIYQATNGTQTVRLAIASDNTAYVGTTSNDPLKILTNGNEVARFDTAGNFAIGVTSSAWSTSYKAFQIGSGTSISLMGGNGASEIDSNAYYDGTNYRYVASSFATSYSMTSGTHRWFIAPSGTAGNAISFTQAMTLDASGNLSNVGTFVSGNITSGSGSNTAFVARKDLTDNVAWNAANTSVFIGKNIATARSINLAGTSNASGADYAEYEHNGGLTIAKGAVVGFKADGSLTMTFSEAIRFGIKSTNPSYVGGDTWGDEEVIGAKPVQPIRKADKTETTGEGEDVVTTVIEAGDTDAEWAAKEASYAAALATWEAALEAARQLVDRIAYSGKVPCNVTGATAGGYIIAVDNAGAIAGEFVADPDFAQYKKAVGRVNRILPDGRCEVAVIIH